MARKIENRWPLEPVLDLLGNPSLSEAGTALGYTKAGVAALKRRGLSPYTADEVAIRLGVHPVEVWGWAWVASAEQEVGA